MIWEHATRRTMMWSILILAAVGMAIAGCSASREGDTRAARDPSLKGQADPPDPAADPPAPSAAAKRGKQLFDTLGCQGCHVVNGQGGTAGPDLSDEAGKGRSREWLVKQIRNPRANDPQTTMPAYDYLSDDKVTDLVDYLQGLSTGSAGSSDSGRMSPGAGQAGQTAPPVSPASVTAGGKMWSRQCGRCHNLRLPSEYSDAQWAVAVQHMRVRVPLTGEEQRKILEFLKATN